MLNQVPPAEREPTRTKVIAAPARGADTRVQVPPEPTRTRVYAQPESSETVLYAPPATVVYQPEPTNTVLYAPPEPEPEYEDPDDEVDTAVEPSTDVLTAPIEPPTGYEEVGQPTRVVALSQFNDNPTRIISLHELFSDKTDAIPREEILALAKAAQAAVREVSEASRVGAPPADERAGASRSEDTRGRAWLRQEFETAARRLPPPGWATRVSKREVTTTREAPAPPPPPEPKPVAELPEAQAPELAEVVLIEHFVGASEALRQALPSEGDHDQRALAEGPQAHWRANLDVLKLNGELAARLVLLPTLFDPEQSRARRFAAALALFNMKGGSGVLDAIEDFDRVCHGVVSSALAHIDDGVRAEGIVAMGSALTQGERRLDWLGVYATRAADPGRELIQELLASREPDELAMGLRLIPLHANARAFVGPIDRHLLSTKPAIRSAALVAGLALARPSAWMQCKQAARAPDSPEPCLLLATLGGERDRSRLISWAKRAAVPAYAGWALAVSGYPAAILASIEIAEGGVDSVHEAAIAGFNIATGAEVDSWMEAKDWWAVEGEGFEVGRRYLRGEPMTSTALAAELMRGSVRWREALALELLVRTRGAMKLPTAFMPTRAPALAEALAELELDFEADYSALPILASR